MCVGYVRIMVAVCVCQSMIHDRVNVIGGVDLFVEKMESLFF